MIYFSVSPYPPFLGGRFGPYLPPPTFVPSGTSRFLTSGFPPGFATSVGPSFGGPVDFPTSGTFTPAGFSPSPVGFGGVPGRLSGFSPSAASAASFGARGVPSGAALGSMPGGSMGSFPGAGSSLPLTSGSGGLVDSVSGTFFYFLFL